MKFHENEKNNQKSAETCRRPPWSFGEIVSPFTISENQWKVNSEICEKCENM